MARKELTDDDYQNETALLDYCLEDYVKEHDLVEIEFSCYRKAPIDFDRLDQQ